MPTALSIKTEEADRLARELAAMTGETMTEAVTKALKERMERLKVVHTRSDEDLPERLEILAARLRKNYDFSRPVTRQEWDEVCGDAPEELGF